MNFNFPVSVGASAFAAGLFAVALAPAPVQAVTCNPVLLGCAGSISEGIFTASLISQSFTPQLGDIFELEDLGGSALVTYKRSPSTVIPIGSTLSYTLTTSGGNLFTTAGASVTGQSGVLKGISLASGSFVNSPISGSCINLTCNATSTAIFNPGLTSAAFVATTSGNGTISSFNSQFETVSSNTVPGPLPILGAAAAFRLSRRMRNRIKAAA